MRNLRTCRDGSYSNRAGISTVAMGSILRLSPGIEIGLARLLPRIGAARLVPPVLERGPARLVPGVAAAVGLALVEVRAGALAGAVDAARMAGIVIRDRGRR